MVMTMRNFGLLVGVLAAACVSSGVDAAAVADMQINKIVQSFRYTLASDPVSPGNGSGNGGNGSVNLNPWAAAGYLPPPTFDAWYAPPEGWETTGPGTALKVRAHAYPTINIRYCHDTFQVLYRSSDTH